jgi:hypothetical protein
MDIEKYEFLGGENPDTKQIAYYFESVSEHKIIKKGVYFQPKSTAFEYNMALGDVNDKTGEPDFLVMSNNGDLTKIMATIFGIGIDFFKKYPNSIVYFLGNKTRKTKIYHWIISKHLTEISQYFEVYGVLFTKERDVEEFNPESVYRSFVIASKKDFFIK